MIVPFPPLWGSHRALEPDHRIDRALYSRTHRLIAAIAYDRSFESLNGCLAVTTGHGKFIRLKHSVCRKATIPETLRQQCLEIDRNQLSDIGIIQPILADLAAVQAGMIEKLKIDAGKYVDRIMAVAIKEPGIWRADFDRRKIYTSFSDPVILAELTGMNVIDAFPARDLMVGGNGHPLDGLPLWLLLAERTPTVSKTDKWLMIMSDPLQIYFLPASDGLDTELPEIQYFTCGLDEKRLNAEVNQRIREQQSSNRAVLLIACPQESSLQELQQKFPQRYEQIVRLLDLPIPIVDLDGLAATHDGQACSTEERRGIHSSDDSMELCPQTYHPPASALSSSVAAILGLMHIDQMAGNLPWLTGAESQRILGRLTPGRPTHWRQLIRSMADHQPAAMKLKDAV